MKNTEFCLRRVPRFASTLGTTVLLISSVCYAALGTVKVLHTFRGPDGLNPTGLLAEGPDGNLYGTAYGGGGHAAKGYGTVFKITRRSILTTLHVFSGGSDGGGPYGGLILGRDGSFYGTTTGANANQYGTVFKITPKGVLTTLHTFTGGDDGKYPYGALVQGEDGSFYGTTAGATLFPFPAQWSQTNPGTVFQITPTGVLTTIYHFSGQPNDQGHPYAGLVQGPDGFFYGTALGIPQNNDVGLVYKIKPSGVLHVVHWFTGDDGGYPVAPVAMGHDGYLYGTGLSWVPGGINLNAGDVLFKAGIPAAGTHGFKTLFSFTSNDNLYGDSPYAGLVQASDGNLYGTTELDGERSCGTVYQVTPAGTVTTIHSFSGKVGDGCFSLSGLIEASDGNLYGSASGGGGTINVAFGVVYKVELH